MPTRALFVLQKKNFKTNIFTRSILSRAALFCGPCLPKAPEETVPEKHQAALTKVTLFQIGNFLMLIIPFQFDTLIGYANTFTALKQNI